MPFADRFLAALTLAMICGLPLASPCLAAEAASVAGDQADLAPVVTVATALERTMVERTIITGTLVPKDEVLVTPEIGGYRVTELLVEEGASVTKGQVLARLSHDMLDRQIAKQAALIAKAEATVTQAQSSIVQADAEHTQATLALGRARQLLQSGNSTAEIMESRIASARTSDGKLDFARTGLAIATADLAQARAAGDELALQLTQTEIRAPVGGLVSRRDARVGATASTSGDAMFRIIANGTIELEGDVIETRLPSLKVGQPVTLKLDDGAPVLGNVRVVYPEVDKATRLGKVRVELSPDPRLHIGAFVAGRVETKRMQAVAVPVAAVLYGADRESSVLVVRPDNTVEQRAIHTSLIDGQDIGISDGLSAGERVVARAGSFLRAGDRIKPVPMQSSADLASTQ